MADVGPDPVIVVLQEPEITSVLSTDTLTLIATEQVIELISEGQQGPSGIPGPMGPPGPGGSDLGSNIVRPTVGALGGHRVVFLDEQGRAGYASNDTLAHAQRVVGITTSANNVDAPTSIATFGDVNEPSWNWTLDQPIYLGTNGLLTQTPPAAPAVFSLVIGFPVSSTTLFVNPASPIVLTL